MFGVINIYKPKGLTSHDVVGIVRKILGIKQVGHTGTLDPFAEGVLPICVGKATRLIEYFDDDKEYLATVKFGAATSTYDIEGEITNTSQKLVTQEEILKELDKFKGKIQQYPPMYSAIKINGKKLYEYARKGETVEVEPREITIYESDLVSFDYNSQVAVIRIKCSKGTYIRSIANDLGENLSCFGHLIKLERTLAGKFAVENSVNLPVEFLTENSEDKFVKYTIRENAKNILENNIQNPIAGISLPVTDINEAEYKRIINGNPITKSSDKLKSGDFLILIYNNCIVAVGQYEKNEIKVKKVFVQ